MALVESLYPPLDWAAHQASWPHARHSRFIDLPDQSWHVQIVGQGPALLLLHGTGAASHSWRDLVLPLSTRFCVICPDLPGHAFSRWNPQRRNSLNHMADSLANLLAHLNLWPDAIVGHSAGAAVGAQLILQHGQGRVTKLVGLNPAWFELTGAQRWLFAPTAKLLALNPWSAWLFAKRTAQLASVQRLLEGTGSKLNAAGLAYYQTLLQSSAHVRGVLAMMASWQLKQLTPRLAQLQAPVYLLLAAQDRIIPPAAALQTKKLLPNLHSHIMPSLGHLAHEEAPELVCQHILCWLDGVAT